MFIFFGIGAAIGNAVSGLICGILYRFNRAFVPVVIAIGYLISMPLLSLLFSPAISEGLSAAWSFVCHAVLLFTLGVLLNIPGPALKVLLLNVNRPHCRGTTTAVGELFNNVGRIVGPVVFTCLLRSRDRVASTLSISNFFYVSAALSFLLRYTVEEDEDAVKEYIHNVKVSPMERDVELDKKNEIVPLLQFSLCSRKRVQQTHHMPGGASLSSMPGGASSCFSSCGFAALASLVAGTYPGYADCAPSGCSPTAGAAGF